MCHCLKKDSQNIINVRVFCLKGLIPIYRKTAQRKEYQRTKQEETEDEEVDSINLHIPPRFHSVSRSSSPSRLLTFSPASSTTASISATPVSSVRRHSQEGQYHRDYLHKKAVKSKDHDIFQAYKHARNDVTNKIRLFKKEYYLTSLDESKFQPKKMWRTLKNVLPSKHKSSNIPTLEHS